MTPVLPAGDNSLTWNLLKIVTYCLSFSFRCVYPYTHKFVPTWVGSGWITVATSTDWGGKDQWMNTLTRQVSVYSVDTAGSEPLDSRSIITEEADWWSCHYFTWFICFNKPWEFYESLGLGNVRNRSEELLRWICCHCMMDRKVLWRWQPKQLNILVGLRGRAHTAEVKIKMTCSLIVCEALLKIYSLCCS